VRHVHATPEEFEKATITGRFVFVFEETRAGKTHYLFIYLFIYLFFILIPSFSKSSVFKMFSVHSKSQSRRFQIPPV